jgi:hypothetical protein
MIATDLAQCLSETQVCAGDAMSLLSFADVCMLRTRWRLDGRWSQDYLRMTKPQALAFLSKLDPRAAVFLRATPGDRPLVFFGPEPESEAAG